MQNVSSLFKDSCDNSILFCVFKIIVSQTKSGSPILTLNNEDFIESTASIEKQTNSSAQFTIGGVCSSKLSLTLTRDGVNKLKANNCFAKKYCLHVIQWNKVEDNNQSDDDPSLNKDGTENTSGKCELGYYYISEVENKDYDCKLIAYDGMIAYEKTIKKAKLRYLRNNRFTIEEWIEWCNTECSNSFYELSYAGSKSELNDMTYRISDDSEVNTYRDVLGYLSQLCAGFLTFNEDGELYYSDCTLTSKDDTIEVDRVISYDFDSEESYISQFITSVGGVDYESDEYEPIGNYNTVELAIQENLFLRGVQYDEDELSPKVQDTLDAISLKICNKHFFGCNITITPRPFLDLGDMLEVKHIIVSSNGDIQTTTKNRVIVNHMLYNFGSSLQIQSYSSVADSTISKSSAVPSIVPDTGQNTNAFIHYDGVKDIILGEAQTKRLFKEYFSIGANLPCTMAFVAVCNITKAGVLYFDVYYDTELQLIIPTYTIQNLGYQTFSFTMGFAATETAEVHNIEIKIRSGDCELELNSYKYQLIIMASGVTNEGASWTGVYELIDTLPEIKANNIIKLAQMTENVQVKIEPPFGPSTTETFRPISGAGIIKLVSLSDNLVINKYKYKPKYKLLSTDATLTGSANLAEDADTEAGYRIQQLGSYPNNIASFSLIVDKTTNYRIVINTKNSGRVILQLDGTIIAENFNTTSSVYQDYEIVKNVELATVDTHTIVLSSSGTSPYINYIRIDEIIETEFYSDYSVSTTHSDYQLEYDNNYIDNVDDFNLKELVESTNGVAETIDSGYCYSITVDDSNFSEVESVGVDFEL